MMIINCKCKSLIIIFKTWYFNLRLLFCQCASVYTCVFIILFLDSSVREWRPVQHPGLAFYSTESRVYGNSPSLILL